MPGTRVRVIREPHFGEIGVVTALPSELQKIETDFGILQMQFDESLINSSSEPTILMGKFFSLQIRERKVRLAQEWPIDITFISKLFALILVPVIVRMVIWAIMGIT